jgi:hypothetical protein
MARVGLIHWKAEEARERVAGLRRSGHRVRWKPLDPASLRAMKASPPDVFVIDLTRMPSQGRDVGVELRRSGATRRVPIVFVGGAQEKVTRVRELLPDAIFTSWERIESALARALRRPRADPVVPDSSFAAYAGVSLTKKLGIRRGSVVALVSAPKGFEKTLGSLPEDARLTRGMRGGNDLAIWFVRTEAELRGEIRRMAARAGGDGLWIAWPKKNSPLASDLSQSIVREAGLNTGLVDYKVCAIDSDWSGLKFTVRRPRRAAGSE